MDAKHAGHNLLRSVAGKMPSFPRTSAGIESNLSNVRKPAQIRETVLVCFASPEKSFSNGLSLTAKREYSVCQLWKNRWNGINYLQILIDKSRIRFRRLWSSGKCVFTLWYEDEHQEKKLLLEWVVCAYGAKQWTICIDDKIHIDIFLENIVMPK